MYKNITYAVTGLLVCVISISALTVVRPVHVDAQTPTEAAVETQASDIATSENESLSGSEKKTTEQRIQAYKEKQTEKLAEAQAKRVQARCKAAQEKVTALQKQVATTIEKRKTAYDAVDTKISALLEKLQKAGIDTKAYETAREDVKIAAASLSEDMDAYGFVLDDLVAMDCAADPDAFKAALEAARTTQKQLREQSQAFRSLVKTDIKALMQEIRTQLEALAAASNQADTTTTGENQ